MTYEEAKLIAQEHAPELLIDPPYKDLPSLFAVRKSAKGNPFSIHLSSVGEPDEQRELFIASLNGANEFI